MTGPPTRSGPRHHGDRDRNLSTMTTTTTTSKGLDDEGTTHGEQDEVFEVDERTTQVARATWKTARRHSDAVRTARGWLREYERAGVL